jgi:uncharacterized protein
VLVDTGPLVAILSRADHHHESCVDALQHLPGPLLSCWPVITEAAWLLRRYPQAVQRLLGSVDGGFIELLPLAGADAKAISQIMQRFASIRPQLADAALVHLAAREDIDTIFTLDERDFSVYRSGRKGAFKVLPGRG